MNSVETTLLEAKEAAAQIAERARQERLAAMLPGLQTAVHRQKMNEITTANIETQRETCKAQLTAVKDKMTAVRREYEAWQQQGERMAAVVARLESEIREAGMELYTAVYEQQATLSPEGSGFISAAGTNGGFAEEWEWAGGVDERLALAADLTPEARSLLSRAGCQWVYDPRKGSKLFFSYR